MSTIRKNVVEHWYLAHCLVNGVGCDEFVRAETDTIARARALSKLVRIYSAHPGMGEYEVVGVERIAEGLDCRATMAGECVMQSSYCIRREIGECLLQRPKYRGKLYLVRGSKRYALHFDCKACKMMVFEE